MTLEEQFRELFASHFGGPDDEPVKNKKTLMKLTPAQKAIVATVAEDRGIPESQVLETVYTYYAACEAFEMIRREP